MASCSLAFSRTWAEYLRSEKIRRLVAPNKKKPRNADTQPGLETQTKKPQGGQHRGFFYAAPVRFYRAGVNGSRAAQTPKARNDLKVPALVSTNIIVCGSCDRNVTRRIGLKTWTCRKEDGDGGRTLLRGLFRSVWGTNDGTKRDCESCELDQARLSARELTIVRRSIPLTQGLVKEAA